MMTKISNENDDKFVMRLVDKRLAQLNVQEEACYRFFRQHLSREYRISLMQQYKAAKKSDASIDLNWPFIVNDA